MNKTSYDQLKETLYSEKLENGLQIFLLPKPEMAKTFAIFSTNYGSIDQTFVPIGETEEVTVPDGIAHFLEHKLFEKKDRDVFQDFTKQGASANAFTSFTKTAYLFSATTNIKENVKTLLDFVQEPYFSEQSVEKEKGIIGQEIKMYDDQPDWRSFFGTIQSLFEKHPVRTDIAGTVDSIQNITKDTLYTCYNTFYHPSNMTFFVAGNFNPEEMMKLIEENQANKSFVEPTEIKRSFPNEPARVAEKKRVIKMPVSTAKCMVGIKEKGELNSEQEFLHNELLTEMLLDYYFSKSGSFYQELYEQDLIDHSFQFETNLERDFGFSIIGGNSTKPDQLADTIQEMLHRLKNSSIKEEDFQRMKRKKIGMFLRAMNSLEFVANQFTHYHLLGIDLFNVLPEIEQLTVKEANQFVEQWIDEDRISVCQIVPS
ncbi:insulinase family protein [Aquibacillus sp. 3ASR75-11]|uniref:Insulinase family protein n=1 Tax=Terrihalobacillus insolitus TaxID=2950438 RepID=A0A9X4AKN9_9BACI|nr:pitrilysin family protein [Terrihalobacillus insolitus]MDC3414076.1 insulinase family protein [Terrihalobacillus insolitus]MDC3423517.1 insulinase family protein [Terrihalobacillus insolitus]